MACLDIAKIFKVEHDAGNLDPLLPQQLQELTESCLSPASGLGCISLKGSSSPTSLQPQKMASKRIWLPVRASKPGGRWSYLDPIKLGGNNKQKQRINQPQSIITNWKCMWSSSNFKFQFCGPLSSFGPVGFMYQMLRIHKTFHI